jgi:hypothetical protein
LVAVIIIIIRAISCIVAVTAVPFVAWGAGILALTVGGAGSTLEVTCVYTVAIEA